MEPLTTTPSGHFAPWSAPMRSGGVGSGISESKKRLAEQKHQARLAKRRERYRKKRAAAKAAVVKPKSKSKSAEKKKKISPPRSLPKAPQIMPGYMFSPSRSKSGPKLTPMKAFSRSRSNPNKYALIVRPPSKKSKSKKKSAEDLRYALIPRPPSLRRPPSLPKARPPSVDYKARHARCEAELAKERTDYITLQSELEALETQQSALKESIVKDLEAFVKKANATLKKIR